jgi:hypothetical protein
MDIWSILRTFGTFCGHSVYIFCDQFGIYFFSFGMLHQVKSGNPDRITKKIDLQKLTSLSRNHLSGTPAVLVQKGTFDT